MRLRQPQNVSSQHIAMAILAATTRGGVKDEGGSEKDGEGESRMKGGGKKMEGESKMKGEGERWRGVRKMEGRSQG